MSPHTRSEPDPEGTIRSAVPLWTALEARVLELEMALARAGQVVTGVGLLVALWFTVGVSRELGVPLVVVAGIAAVWFTAVHEGYRRGIGVRWLRWAAPISEVAMPLVVLLVMASTQGPAYALGSWVPPQLWGVFVFASIARLRPALPALLGAIAATEYAVAYWAFLYGAVAGDGVLLHRPIVQMTRAASLLIAGLAGSVAVMGLHRAVARANRELRAADLFGKYRLGPTIASGGMGKVIEALYCPEGGFERRVAMKLVHPHLAEDASFVAKFRREAELCAALSHPNIVAALDFGRAGDTWFFAMEFVDGTTVRDLQDHRAKAGEPLPVRVSAFIVHEIAQALHFAHAVARDADGQPLRVVHRDLTPANVLLSRSGQVKVADFGVARALRDAAQLHTTNLAGKPSYLAPETLRHERFDERSDLFALGVLLWELIANRRLFARENDGATILAVVEAEIPRVSELRPGVDADWDVFLARALARDPDQRFASAAAFGAALQALQGWEGAAGPDDVAAVVAEALAIEELDLDLEEEEELVGA